MMIRSLLRRQLASTCARSLHQIIQRDTHLPIPTNDVFIITPDVAPVLECLDFKELQTELQKRGSGGAVVRGTFVINGVGAGNKKMNKVRGVTAFSEKIQERTILAVCESASHEVALSTGATLCLDPVDIGKISDGEVNIDEFESVVCTSACLKALSGVARILKAKMPHPRKGTVHATIGNAIRASLLNVEWEMTESRNHPDFFNIEVPLFKADFPVTTIQDHVKIMFDDIHKYRPAKMESETFVTRVELNLEEGDPIHLDIREYEAAYTKQTEVAALKRQYSREETRELRAKAKDKQGYLDKEREKIANFLENRWETVMKD